MSMKEAKALEKWCPMARVVEKHNDGNTSARNRVVVINGPEFQFLADELAGAKCIGSRCMMWNWTTQLARGANPDNREGYCALAGPGISS